MITLKNLIQGTHEWVLFRKDGIGSSESSVLMNANKYETVSDLYLKKIESPLYVPKEYNEAMQHGNKNEDFVRNLINVEHGTNFQPICGIHPEKSYIRSSYDGIDGNKAIEIKCPLNQYSYYNHCKKIPNYYYCQIQHHFLTNPELTEEYFVSWFENKKVIWRVLPNPDYMLELEKRITLFWKYVEEKQEPDYGYFI